MNINIYTKEVPSFLQGPQLVDRNGLPRFWATAWSILNTNGISDSTRSKHLRNIDQLYQFSEDVLGPAGLDDAIASVDISAIASVLEGYLTKLSNTPEPGQNAQAKWETAIRFVRDVVMRIKDSAESMKGMDEIEARMRKIDLSFGQLRVGRARTQQSLRALPAIVVQSLFEILDPASSSNPFHRDVTRWRVYLLFILLLNQGLRRGEALLLPVNAVKDQYDDDFGRVRFWINIQNSLGEESESRYSRPSIKTEHSFRQLPMSESTALILQTYAENFRGKPDHSFLFNSQKNKPLSTESITKLFKKISGALPQNALDTLKNRTGKTSITPHDLRHTAAVVRLDQMLKRGDSMDEALQKMRSFFGWSRTSDMPTKYARSVFEERLAKVWTSAFDDRVAIIRAIPGGDAT